MSSVSCSPGGVHLLRHETDEHLLAVSFSTAFCMVFAHPPRDVICLVLAPGGVHLSRHETDDISAPFHFPRPFAWVFTHSPRDVICLELAPGGVHLSRHETDDISSPFHFPRPFALVFAHSPRDVICLVPRQMDTSWLAVSFSTAFCIGFCASSKRCHLSRTSTDGHLMARRFIFYGLLHGFLRILQEMSSVSYLDRWTPHGSPFHFPRPFA